jgi:probable F420-dependent oxidoreductase
MEIGVSIPHMGPLASPSFVPEFCRRAEEAGFDGLWAADHLVVPKEMGSTYTLARRPVVIQSEGLQETMGLNLEVTTTLAVAAAVTHRVKIGTSVAVLPLRNPIHNARQLASVDLYSGGRLVYGVGVGWLREEAEAMGMPWDHRGARSEEHIAVLRAIWNSDGDWVSFDGRFYSFPPIDPDPRPGRTIPILIGGHSDIALDRAARIGDGWIATMGADRLGTALPALREACARRDRDPAGLWVVSSSAARLRGDATAAGIVDELRGLADLGVDHAQVRVGQPTEQGVLDELDRWGYEILPRLREAS